jgi:hypothetical protein
MIQVSPSQLSWISRDLGKFFVCETDTQGTSYTNLCLPASGMTVRPDPVGCLDD